MCFIINFLLISFAHLWGFLVFFLFISEIFWLIRNTKRLKVPCVEHGMQNWASGPKRNGEGWTELAWFGRLPEMDEEEGDVRMIPRFLAWAVLSLEKLFTEILGRVDREMLSLVSFRLSCLGDTALEISGGWLMTYFQSRRKGLR